MVCAGTFPDRNPEYLYAQNTRLPTYKKRVVYCIRLLSGRNIYRMAIYQRACMGYYKFPGRILFMFPAYQLGYLYKKHLEKYDTLPNGLYFAILFLVQLIVVLSCNGLAYSAVWCTGFVNGPFIPYITCITGIAFWLRISKILAPLYNRLKYVRLIGENTYAIMMHHILGFLLLNAFLYAISVPGTLLEDFDRIAFSPISVTYTIQTVHMLLNGSIWLPGWASLWRYNT